MDENLPDILKGGLSREEQKWLHNWFDVLEKNQTKQIHLLERINIFVTILAILALLGVVLEIILAISS